jgi:hypothetical protein
MRFYINLVFISLIYKIIYILYKVKLKQLLVPDPGSTLGRPGVLGLGWGRPTQPEGQG